MLSTTLWFAGLKKAFPKSPQVPFPSWHFRAFPLSVVLPAPRTLHPKSWCLVHSCSPAGSETRSPLRLSSPPCCVCPVWSGSSLHGVGSPPALAMSAAAPSPPPSSASPEASPHLVPLCPGAVPSPPPSSPRLSPGVGLLMGPLCLWPHPDPAFQPGCSPVPHVAASLPLHGSIPPLAPAAPSPASAFRRQPLGILSVSLLASSAPPRAYALPRPPETPASQEIEV